MARILCRKQCGGGFSCVQSSRRMQRSWLSLLLLFLIHSASMFPEIFVALDIQLYKVADFDRVDFPSTTVTDLRQQNSVIQCNQQLFNISLDIIHSWPHSWMCMQKCSYSPQALGETNHNQIYATYWPIFFRIVLNWKTRVDDLQSSYCHILIDLI